MLSLGSKYFPQLPAFKHNMFYSLQPRDDISHYYKASKIKVVFILSLRQLERAWNDEGFEQRPNVFRSYVIWEARGSVLG
jgi:hypothetical protein